MATYVLPQVLVFQDFTIQPAVEANPLSAHIAGGHAYLVRENESNERDFGSLGLYVNDDDTSILWPNRPAGGIVDQSYTKLFIENALLRYYSHTIGGGTTIIPVTNYPNRIKSWTMRFADSPGYSRNEVFQDRDVQIGDVVRVHGVPTGTGSTGDAVTLWTYVRGLIASDVPADILTSGTDFYDANNAETQGSLAVSATRTGGIANYMAATAVGTAYNGLPSGHVTETYVLRVIQSSIGQDLTTARLRVTSGSGTDNQASIAPQPATYATSIGTRGLTVTFTNDDELTTDPDLSSTSLNNLIVGQEFTVTIAQEFDRSTIAVAGTYTSRNDTTYIIKVSKGGFFDSDFPEDFPEITVTTTNGIDQSGPHVVSNFDTAIAIGTNGLQISFQPIPLGSNPSGLNKGDRYYVEVQGISSGPIKTLVLAQNLDSHFQHCDDLEVDFYIRKPLLEVTANRTGMAPLTNWEQSETEITLKSGIVAYDATWTVDGQPLPLDVYSSVELDYGKLYVQYRAWLPTLANKVNSIIDVATIDDISGPLTPDNPLKWGVFKALTNSNGTPVLYTAVTDPNDVNTWDEVLEAILSRDDAYELVPLTRNPAVFSLYQAHVNNVSAPTEGLWRVAWFNLKGIPEIPIVSAGSTIPNHLIATTTNGQPALAVFSDDPLTSDSQYTICRVPAANSNFLTNDVRAGDIVRAIYTNDGFGGVTYSEFVVDDVQSENQIRLKAGPDAPQTVPAKIEVWRNLSAIEEADEIGKAAGAFNDRRIRATWPDVIESSGTLQEGYFLNCALAGLASGVLPHQGLTRLAIAGFSSTQRTNDKFSKPQLNRMALDGVWIVQQTITGEIYTRHAVTTGDYVDINQREEMLTRNVDSISYRFKDFFEPYIGVTNVTPSMEEVIRLGLNKLISTLRIERTTPNLGGQLIDATVDRFFISTMFKDRYVAYINLQVPYALNNIELHLVV